MGSLKKWMIGGVALAILLGWQGGAPATARLRPTGESEKELLDVTQKWAEAVRTGNIERIVAFYVADDRLRGVDATDTAVEFRTRDQCRHYWQEVLNRPDRVLNFEVRQLEAQVEGKLGFVQGQWQMERENGQNGKKYIVGTLTLLLVQQNRQWRIQHDHRSKLKEVFVGMAVGAIGSPGPALVGGQPEYAAAVWKGDGKSGIQGVAMASPIHGGPERIGEKNSAPLANALITIRPLNDDKPIASVRTDAQGRYRIPLKPGRYRLVPFGPQPGSRLPRAEASEIVVTSGRFASLQIDYDTGLR